MSACKSCGAPIFWAKTMGERLMPLDLEPYHGGNVILRDGVALVLSKETAPAHDDKTYRSHFATCPGAGQHRKVTP